MTKEQMKSFLDQFKKSARNIKEWPKWMQDATYVATAHFPKSKKSK